MGLGFAARGLRTLVVELGADGGLGRAAGTSLDEPVEVRARCTLMSLATQPALRSFLEAHLPSRRLARFAADNGLLSALFGAAPGTVEVAQLDAIERFAGRWDRVVIDGEATGHTLLFLELPRVFAGLGAGGVLGTRLSRIDALLHGPSFAVHVATLPQALVETETRALGAGLARLGVARGALLVSVDAPLEGDVFGAYRASMGTAAEEDLAFECARLERAAALDALAADDGTGFARTVRVPRVDEPTLDALTERGLAMVAALEPS